MAKPKSPLLSLGARGSIGDTLTFQKRGRITIARQKPIPTDPKTDLQLAQRQVYREAIAAWNALTPEEKEAYRGVCPGLTPYQCYMKTALAAAPPEPPPEEQTEEQTQSSTLIVVGYPDYEKSGQRLFIPNRQITKLAFLIQKWGSPIGSLYYEIRRITPDELIYNQLVGDASSLPETPEWIEITLDTPQTIDEEVRILAHVTEGTDENHARIRAMNSDVKENEILTRWHTDFWDETLTYDCAYRYKYYEV
ncbi:hypothetical protein ES708_12309 [subsurface metagenome]